MNHVVRGSFFTGTTYSFSKSAMLPRSALRVLAKRQCIRRLATQPPKITLTASASPTPPPPSAPPKRQKTWLTRKLEGSPIALSALRGLGRILGYGSPEQIAGRRTFVLYKQLCAVRPDEESAFWQNGEWCTFTHTHLTM